MKRELPPAVIAVVIAVIVLVLGGWIYAATQGPEGHRPSGPDTVGGHKVLPQAKRSGPGG